MLLSSRCITIRSNGSSSAGSSIGNIISKEINNIGSTISSSSGMSICSIGSIGIIAIVDIGSIVQARAALAASSSASSSSAQVPLWFVAEVVAVASSGIIDFKRSKYMKQWLCNVEGRLQG